MRYLENAIKFLIKNWILAIPLFILTALAYLLSGRNTANAANMWSSLSNMGMFNNVPNASRIFPFITPFISTGGGFWIFLVSFISIPLSYGLVNKCMETRNSNLNEAGQTLSQNFVKYVMYFVGTLVLTICIVIAGVIISLISILIAFIPILGGIISFIIFLALAIAAVVIFVLLSMWFSAMVVDGLDVIGAAKKSIEVVKASFWTVLGITILVSIATGIVGWILNWLGFIPLLGPIIASLAPTAQTFVMLTFLLMLYREKTGKTNSI